MYHSAPIFRRVLPATPWPLGLRLLGPLLLGPLLLAAQPVSPAPRPAGTPSTPHPSPETAPATAPVTVLPVLGFVQGASVAADLTGVLFAELRAAEVPDVRIRKPAQPLAISCITQLACLAQAGRAVQAERLLVGVVGSKDEGKTLFLTLLLVTIPKEQGNAIPLKSASRTLSPADPLNRAPLQALVAELAPFAGAPLRHPAPPVAADASLLERIQQVSPPAEPAPAAGAPAPSAPSAALEPSPVVARGQRLLQSWEEQRRQEQESRERDERARQDAQLQARRNREEARAADAQRRLELQEARRRADAELKYKESLEKNRLENQERLQRGLPPLPPPPPPAEPARRAPKARNGPESGSAKAPASMPQSPAPDSSSAAQARGSGRSAPATPGETETLGVVQRSARPSSVFLEGEGRWMFLASAHGASLAGYGLVGAALELSYQPIPHVQELWTILGYRSLHGFEVGSQRWFYLHSAQAGALWRLGSDRIHPLAGLQLETLLLSEDVLGLGASARAGLDLMLLDSLGIRLDVALGGLYGFGLTERLNYPSNGQLTFRAAVGSTFRF